jgi:hypothetical protein
MNVTWDAFHALQICFEIQLIFVLPNCLDPWLLGLFLLPEKTLCIGYRLKSHCFSLKFGENLPVKKSLAQIWSLVFRFCSLTSLREHLQRCSVCNPPKIIFTSKFSYIYFFATPPIKLKLGQQIGGGLLIGNHLDQSL